MSCDDHWSRQSRQCDEIWRLLPHWGFCMHHVSQTLSTSDDDACKTLNEVKVVNLVTVTRCRHTTYFKGCVSTRARYAYFQGILSTLSRLHCYLVFILKYNGNIFIWRRVQDKKIVFLKKKLDIQVLLKIIDTYT